MATTAPVAPFQDGAVTPLAVALEYWGTRIACQVLWPLLLAV
jgi:hypothetical protein